MITFKIKIQMGLLIYYLMSPKINSKVMKNAVDVLKRGRMYRWQGNATVVSLSCARLASTSVGNVARICVLIAKFSAILASYFCASNVIVHAQSRRKEGDEI